MRSLGQFQTFFFHNKILHALKAQKRIEGTKGIKSTKKYKNTTKQKHKNANKWIKIKMRLKTSKPKKVTYSLIFEEKSLQ